MDRKTIPERLIFRNILKIENGFTLTELLVTVTIIGVLSGIAVLTFGNSRVSAMQQACKTNYSTLLLAISSFQSDNLNSLNMNIVPTIKDLIPNYLNKDLLFNPSFAMNIETSTSGIGDFSIRVSKAKDAFLVDANLVGGTNSLTVASATNLRSGQEIFGSGIPNSTKINIVNSNSIIMSQNATTSLINSPTLFGGSIISENAPLACERL